ncbi:MAG: hypothetical protein JWR34_6527, partial [Mycobacterium sp.]|nr:hypothetical protein [Mycobacterium sp.]
MLGSVVIVVKLFEFDGWDVAAVLVETSMVEPVDPFEGGDLDVLDGPPGPAWLDQFGLVEAIDRLGEGVVVAVARAPDRGVDARLDQSVGERDRGVPGRIQLVVATPCRELECSWSAKTSVGVLHPSVLRGRLLSASAT